MRIYHRLKRVLESVLHSLKIVACSPITHHASALIALFWVVAYFTPAYILIQIMNYVFIAVAVAVIVSFMPSVLVALKRGYPIDRVAQLTIGIPLAWLASTMIRLWSAGSRILELEWMRNSPVIAFCLFLSACAGVLHLTAPGAIDGHIPHKNWVIVGVAVGAGCLIAGILIGMNLERPPI